MIGDAPMLTSAIPLHAAMVSVMTMTPFSAAGRHSSMMMTVRTGAKGDEAAMAVRPALTDGGEAVRPVRTGASTSRHHAASSLPVTGSHGRAAMIASAPVASLIPGGRSLTAIAAAPISRRIAAAARASLRAAHPELRAAAARPAGERRRRHSRTAAAQVRQHAERQVSPQRPPHFRRQLF
jgi:hypothetical protein